MTEIISLAAERDVALGRARGALRAGEVIVLPTDTVYGIGADAFNVEATRKIFQIKRRPRKLPLPVLVSRPRQAWALCGEVPQAANELAAAFWPGPLTMVLPQAELVWDLGDGAGTFAVRMPAHDDILTLLEMVGPMAVTSANITGEPTPATIEEVRSRLGDAVGVYLDGGPARSEVGSTIVDLTGVTPAIVREGPIPVADLEKILGTTLAG